MTEQEAMSVKCWRTLGAERVGECIGSACMAWRWGSRVDIARDVVTGEERKIVWTPESRTIGYCGLAGKP